MSSDLIDAPEDIEPADRDGPALGGSAQPPRRALVALMVVAVVSVLLVVFLLPLAASERQGQRTDQYLDPTPTFVKGQPAFVLQIPAIDLNEVVVWGSLPADLRGGPGWRLGTASPGSGNTVVLGHSTLWGASFGRLADVPAGSIISVRTIDGRVYRYRVDKVRDVAGSDVTPMQQTGSSRLTLVTSSGGPFSSGRTVLSASPTRTRAEVPEDYEVDVDTDDPGPYDDRSAGDVLLLLGGLALIGIGVWAGLSLRSRRGMLAVALVAGPTVALGIVLVLFHLDALIPTTF